MIEKEVTSDLENKITLVLEIIIIYPNGGAFQNERTLETQ